VCEAPSSSVTVSVTVRGPAVGYVWVVVSPLPVWFGSPKFHAQVSMSPSASSESLPSKVQVRPAQVTVASAVGGWFSGGSTSSPWKGNMTREANEVEESCVGVPAAGALPFQFARNRPDDVA
jgi:hypothetical protein